VTVDGQSPGKCSLEARRVVTDEPIGKAKEPIQGHFRTGLVNPPSSGRYVISIDCGPKFALYRSSEFDFATPRAIDLGRVVMKPK